MVHEKPLFLSTPRLQGLRDKHYFPYLLTLSYQDRWIDKSDNLRGRSLAQWDLTLLPPSDRYVTHQDDTLFFYLYLWFALFHPCGGYCHCCCHKNYPPHCFLWGMEWLGASSFATAVDYLLNFLSKVSSLDWRIYLTYWFYYASYLNSCMYIWSYNYSCDSDLVLTFVENYLNIPLIYISNAIVWPKSFLNRNEGSLDWRVSWISRLGSVLCTHPCVNCKFFHIP